MLHILAFDARGHRVVDDPDLISDLLAEEETIVWVDVRHPEPGELELIESELDLHQLAIEDASKHGQRPKLEHFNSHHAFVVAYAADERTDELVEVDFFVGRNWMITVHDPTPDGSDFDVEECRDRVCRYESERVTSAFLFYVVLDTMVDSYFGLSDRLGDAVDEMEDRIFDDPDPEADEMAIQREMLALRKRLLTFRKRVVPLREVLLIVLREDLAWMTPEARQYLQDVFDHVMRVTDEIDMRRELIGNAVDAHLALASNHMNQTMKRMTSWGAILIVATLIAGIYGMNFENMPELHWRFGYYGALGLMLTATAGLYAYFKRRGWL